MKRAFTIIELLVVVGIIAVLMGALLVATGGATESARAAKCLANLRSLAAAVNSAAMEHNHYPCAGSYEYTDFDTSGQKVKTICKEKVGWISWLSNKGDPYGKQPGAKPPTSHQSIEICPFYGTGNLQDDTYAITNGSIWKATGCNMNVYVCPSHVKYRQDKSRKPPLWSYVMNSWFGYDRTQGSKSIAEENKEYGKVARADRRLLFAEIPMVRMQNGKAIDNPDGEEYECDCTLQFKATVDGKKYGGSWDGTPEEIGFNHVIGKRGRCGHVAYADGHVDKVTYSDKGLTPEELTALLCGGVDVALGEAGWQKAHGQD